MTNIRTEDTSTYSLELVTETETQTENIHMYRNRISLIKYIDRRGNRNVHRRHKQMHDSTDMGGPYKQIHKLHAYS